MKLRRHKNTRWFHVVFQRRGAPPDQVIPHAFVQANSAGEARRGFLFGRDRNNLLLWIREAQT